jgi:hypothetical protein
MLARLSRRDAFAFAALAFALVFIFVDQAHDTGFQKGHRGWCSANVMGIIEHATPSNGFVGHTLQFIRDGKKKYDYFDRYPAFFSAGMHVALNTFELSRGEQIFVARQLMNVLHALTLIAAIAFLLELGVTPGIAVGAVALAAAGRLIVMYRDMIHFDQAALTGFVTLLWALARWYRTRNDRLIYFATAFGVMMGRGYASFAVLAVWWLVELVIAARTSRQALKTMVFGTATRACLLAIAIGTSCLAYNIWREAEKNDVAWTKVGIVDSASRRFLISEKVNESQKKKVAWSKFGKIQVERFVSNAQPFAGPRFQTKNTWINAALTLLGVAVIAAFIARSKRELRPPMIVAALSGVLWIVAMRGLTAFHEFTTMFLFGGIVLLMLALIHWVPERFAVVPALLGCFVLVAATSARNNQLEKQEPKGEVYTKDFARIAEKLKPGDAFDIEPRDRKKLVPGVPYAIGWFLPDNYIENDAKLIVSNKKKRKGSKNLTPDNKKLFLYKEK